MPDVPVNLLQSFASAYTVRIEPGLLTRTGPELRMVSQSSKAIILTDPSIAKLHLPTLVHSLGDVGIEPIVSVLPAGEKNKTLQALLPVFDTILSARIERNTPLLALGGGIVGDMGGFIAASLLRGIPFVQVPTTLLAMVDASVGGKTGVNHVVGKNLIGAFHHPVLVLADPGLLTTLPKYELVGGLAECIKHEIIRDADGFANLEQNLDAILNLDLETVTELVAHNVRIKVKVVEADPLENGERAHLNFGHTFAHAIERTTNHQISHGNAVALGMVAASNLAVDLNMLSGSDRNRIVSLIERAGLPTRDASLKSKALYEAMAYDKKVTSARIRFILPDRIGNVVIRDDVTEKQILSAVDSVTG